MRSAVVVATALVAGIAPVALGGAQAFAVTAPTRAAAAAGAEDLGFITQPGGRLTVPAGAEGPVTLDITASLMPDTTGQLKARITLPITNWPVGGWTDYRTAAQIKSTCSVDGGAAVPCSWKGTSLDEDGPARVVLDLPVKPAAPRIHYAVTLDLPDTLAWIGSLDAPVTLTDETGKVVADGKVGLDVVQGTPDAWRRAALHARDHDGVLWRYEGTGKTGKPFATRTKVGGGWGAYTAVTPVTTATADGRGDLVARDKAGVLWYYKGSGKPSAPFAPRVRVGGGWNEYTALVGRDGDLVARDKAGVLWFYKKTGDVTKPFAARVRVGAGWNTYSALTPQDGGALARDTAGVLWKYAPKTVTATNTTQPYQPRQRVGGGWNTYTAIAGTADLGAYGVPDVVARDASGKLYAYEGVVRNGTVVPDGRTLVGGGWNIYDLIF
ncbi:tachylectin-related carbohydrate-binding protein [Streptomyces sp. NPDC097704]|uniref:tachylectin-related carbohydrate-binding protein n=1 Tax=Streptomyces sp. NPDC097704 TaxID=3157101 RepID=UPI00331839C3